LLRCGKIGLGQLGQRQLRREAALARDCLSGSQRRPRGG